MNRILRIVCWAMLAGFLYGVLHELRDFLESQQKEHRG
jgi:hypothetical protein